MKRLLPLFFLHPSFSFAQANKARVKLIIHLLTPAKNMVISYAAEQKPDTIPFPKDGVWIYSGKQPVDNFIIVNIDSGYPYKIWVDDSPSVVELTEVTTKQQLREFSVNVIDGSVDSKLFSKLTQIGFEPFYIPQTPGLTNEQIRAYIEQGQHNRAYKLVDSLFTLYPGSPVLPYYLNLWESRLGADSLQALYNRLPAQVQNTNEGITVKATITRLSMFKKGNILADFTMTNHKGKPFTLSSLKSRYVLLDFWASWCGPCRAANPKLVTAYQQFKSKGFEIVSISLDEDKKAWLNAVKKDNLPWSQLSDLKGWDNALATTYFIEAVPFYVIIDNQRKVVMAGFRANELNKILADLL